jgi:hypothetical protein
MSVWLFKTSLQIIFLAGEVSEFKLNHFSQKRQFALKTIRHLIADERKKHRRFRL